MTSKTLCFDRAIFRRDLRRTAPLWITYLALVVLLPAMQLLANNSRPISDALRQAIRVQGDILQLGEIVSILGGFLYGAAMAWALWFSLFQTKSAYFYAALPLRRESLFLTRYLTGLLLAVVPLFLMTAALFAASCAVGAPALMACLTIFAAATLSYLFFYSFATLCCMVIGQAAAMPILYTVLNFVFVVVEIIVRLLLETFVYGLPGLGRDYLTEPLSPLYYMLFGLRDFGAGQLVETLREGNEVTTRAAGWEFAGMGYLAILAAVGLLFAILALVLYRRREMERSGDVICVRWVRPVFQYAMTFGTTLVLTQIIKSMVGVRTFSFNFGLVLALLLVGALIGHLLARMLLTKSLKVFRSGWLSLGVCVLVLTLGFGAMRFDLFGYSRRIPAREEVTRVAINAYTATEVYQSTDDPAVIDQTLALHQTLIDERPRLEKSYANYYGSVTIGYELADGSTLFRCFPLPESDGSEPFDPLLLELDAVYNSRPLILARTIPSLAMEEKNHISCTIYHTVYAIPEEMLKYEVEGAQSIDLATEGTQTMTLDSAEAWTLFSTAVLPDLDDTSLGHADYPLHQGTLSFENQDFVLAFTIHNPEFPSGHSTFDIVLRPDAHRTITALKALGYTFD